MARGGAIYHSDQPLALFHHRHPGRLLERGGPGGPLAPTRGHGYPGNGAPGPERLAVKEADRVVASREENLAILMAPVTR